jgi:hypothetical protein
LLLLGVVLILAGFVTTPSFVLVQGQLQAYESQLQSAAAVATEQDTLTAIITEANTQASTAYAAGQLPNISNYLQAIKDIASPSITLSRFEVNRSDTVVSEVVVTGEAVDRISLTQFGEQIESAPQFFEANIPLENLAANENIAFTLRVAVTPES